MDTPSDGLTEVLLAARDAFERRDRVAWDGFVAAKEHGELGAEDLFLLG